MTTHTQSLYPSRPRPAQAGFTLVELMVGVVIGLLTTLVIMQVFTVFEAQKRVTTGASDSLTNGNIALYRMDRDIQQGGFSLIPFNALNSPLNCVTPIPIDPALAASGVSGITPVSIVDGGTGSDTLTVRYGSTQTGGVPTEITAMVGNSATIRSTLGCALNDFALAMNGTACALTSITAVVPSTDAGAGSVTLGNTTAAVNGAYLSCLGPRWHEVTYRINPVGNITLQRQDTALSATFQDNVADIVNIQAQYGISPVGNSNQVNQWVDATGAWAAPAVAARNRIKAIRVAIVARDAKMEPDTVTNTCSSLTAAAPTGLCAWDATAAAPAIASPAPAIDLTTNADWDRYHYRVFETIIPLRNVILAQPYLQ